MPNFDGKLSPEEALEYYYSLPERADDQNTDLSDEDSEDESPQRYFDKILAGKIDTSAELSSDSEFEGNDLFIFLLLNKFYITNNNFL